MLEEHKSCPTALRNQPNFSKNDKEPLLMHGAAGAFHKGRYWNYSLNLLRFLKWIFIQNIGMLEQSFKTRNLGTEVVFRTVFQTILEHDVMHENVRSLNKKLKQNLQEIPTTDICYSIIDPILKYLLI